jgi:N-acyl-D-aspartate/D-glutamate deacylase
MHDLVIRNGRVVDGAGAPARQADVAIDGTRITGVAAGAGAGRREIDATGLLVTPGWVDIHTHYDGQVTWDPHVTPSGWNGVTTVVMGNCGVGFAPVRRGQEEYLIQLMEGVEDIPGTALSDGIAWSWETFPEYLDALDGMPRSLDVGAQVPHGPVRVYAMGERGAKNEKASPQDVERMSAIVRQALQAGALGFSTSRTILHRARDGELVPGTHAEDEEVLGIGRVLGEVGHGVFEVASDLAPEGDELAWMSRLGKETGRPVSFACLQSPVDPDQWRRLLEAVEKDRAEGGCLTPQVAQRPAGLLLGWESSFHPFLVCPAYAPYRAMPRAERIARLRDPEVKRAILASRPDVSGLPGAGAMIMSAFHMMFPLGDPPDYEPGPERSIAALARRDGRDPRELAYELMLERDGRGLIYLPILGYAGGDFEAIRAMMMHPSAVFGLSDGGAHCGLVCDASVPTFLLTHWVRDRTRGERIPLERVVESQTRRTARFYGLADRGVIAPGMKADLNVIDFDALQIHAPEMVYDLPAGARRLVQKIDGYRHTILSGEVTFEDGEPSGALPGRLVRGPQRAPTG